MSNHYTWNNVIWNKLILHLKNPVSIVLDLSCLILQVEDSLPKYFHIYKSLNSETSSFNMAPLLDIDQIS